MQLNNLDDRMDKPNRDLIEKYFNGTATESEARVVYDWFETEEGQQFLSDRFEKDIRNPIKPENHAFEQADSLRILNSIKSSLSKNKRNASKNIYRLQKRNSFRLVAACIILLLAVTYVMKFHTFSESYTGFSVFETGSSEHKAITLRDGTKIRMSENSRLQVPDDFNAGSRSVDLEGQAYFEVVNNPALQFEVHTTGTTIAVLGTAFNVNTLSSSKNVVVAVSEGKVSLEAGSGPEKNMKILTENMMGFINHSSGEILRENTDIHNYLSWIHGNIIFDETPFLKVIEQLGRIYDISNTVENDELLEFRLTANFTRGSLKSVLETIAEGLDIDYKYQDGIVYWSTKQQS